MSTKVDFKTALSVVYRTKNFDEELNNPFLIYSRMSDLIGNDYENKKKLELFFVVEKRVNLFVELKCGTDAKKLKQKYKSVSDLLSEAAFDRLIDTLVESVSCRNGDTIALNAEAMECCEYDSKKISNEEKLLYSDTDSNDFKCDYNYVSVKDRGCSKAFAGCLYFISIVVLVLFGIQKTSWDVYRWIVGVTSMIIILIGSIILSEIIYESIFNCVLFGVFVVANFVLWCVFRGNYRVVCYWVTPAVLIYGVYAIVNAFDDYETTCGWIDVGCCLLSIGTLLLNIFL